MMAYAGIYDIHRPNSWLSQVSLSSHTKFHHTASCTLLTQTFVDPTSRLPITSAKYSFSAYKSSAIVSFRCYVGTRLIEGEGGGEHNFPSCRSTTLAREFTRTADCGYIQYQYWEYPSGGEYIMELKHVDGLRFTVPTSIAPRYGVEPGGMSTVTNTGRMKLSVEISMVTPPIAVYPGGHTSNTQPPATPSTHSPNSGKHLPSSDKISSSS